MSPAETEVRTYIAGPGMSHIILGTCYITYYGGQDITTTLGSVSERGRGRVAEWAGGLSRMSINGVGCP
jgi:hypothetical protein